MSLSKNVISRYRKCPHIKFRYHSGSSNAVNQAKVHNKMMSMTQWKLVNQIKEFFVKLSNDRNMKIALNKEITHMLHKLQPEVYSASSNVRFLETAVTEQIKPKDKIEPKSESSGYAIPNVLSGLKIKRNEKIDAKDLVPKWKRKVCDISKTSIACRTSHVINSIVTAESDQSRLSRIQDLVDHVKQYPEVKGAVVKDGVVRILLRIREQSQDPAVHAVLGKAFALLGHSSPLPGHGIRILAIDGGGIRGLLVIEMLQKLEELTGKKIHQLFDYVCGVSTGAIIACSIGGYQRDLDAIAQNYKEISVKVFSQSALWGTGNLVWSHSYYDTALWETMLKEYLGEEDLLETAKNPNCPKLSAISAIVSQSRVSAYVFRNYSLPWRVQSQYMGGHNHKVWEAVRASAAAPTYFEECKLGNLLHQDGGILVNNPTAVAIHEAKLLWPNNPIQCVVSLGTGRTNQCDSEIVNDSVFNNSSWKTKILTVLRSAYDTEGVHVALNELLPKSVYFRFNPELTEIPHMAEIDPKKLDQLQQDSVLYLRQNKDKFEDAAKVLCETKSSAQKLVDWDGGILVNNPTAVAIHEAKLLWPNHPIQCVVSFGTGRTVPCHPEAVTDPNMNNSSSWKNKFLKILDSATDTEGVHTMLNDLLPGNVYYRFNPYLTEMLNMAEIDPSKLEQLKRDAVMYLRRNEDKFQEAAKVLCETKSHTQKVVDWVNLKRDLLGIL